MLYPLTLAIYTWSSGKEVDSTFSNAYTLSALVNIKLGKLKIAIKNYSFATELANDVFDLEEVYIYRAETYFNLKEYDNAILDLNYFKSLRPDEWNLDASFLEGLIYLEQKKYFVALTQNCFRPEMRMRKSARAMLTSAISREFRNPSFYDEIRAESATACRSIFVDTKEASFC